MNPTIAALNNPFDLIQVAKQSTIEAVIIVNKSGNRVLLDLNRI